MGRFLDANDVSAEQKRLEDNRTTENTKKKEVGLLFVQYIVMDMALNVNLIALVN